MITIADSSMEKYKSAESIANDEKVLDGPGKRMRTPHKYEVKNTLIRVVSAAAFAGVKIVQIFSVATTL